MTAVPLPRADVDQLFDVPVGDLCTGADHLPGLHRPHLEALLDGRIVDLRPVDVEPHGPAWRIRNGRHRWARALIAGEPTVRCRATR